MIKIPEFEALKPFLTDFAGNQYIFQEYFDKRLKMHDSVETVLELGVYQMKNNVDLPGQSTKTLFLLYYYYDVGRMVSLDIDDCRVTIDRCKNWFSNQLDFDLDLLDHTFVQLNSLDYDTIKDFPDGIDFIFLDTCHDDDYPDRIGYKGAGGAGMTYKEICKYAPTLTENGSLFLHDTLKTYVPLTYGYNVCGAVKRFIDEQGNDFEYIEHESNQFGLGEIRRKH